MNSRLLFVVASLLALWLLAMKWNSRPIHHDSGVLVQAAPVQTEVEASRFSLGDYTLTQRARFIVRARILSTERYYLDSGADLSPIDLALGWGVMSDQAVIDQLRISQSARWYRLHWGAELSLAQTEIMRSSGNMHMIPATSGVARILKNARPGEVISLEGYLVDAHRYDGWTWVTSLSRDDVGAGSCELFYVESVDIER